MSSTPPPRYAASPPPSPPTPLLPQHYSPPHLRQRPSFLDELLPTPTSSNLHEDDNKRSTTHAFRRAGSVAVISIFLLVVVFMASTDEGPKVNVAAGLRDLFGVGKETILGSWTEALGGALPGSGGGTSAETETAAQSDEDDARPKKIDFERYSMLRTIPEEDLDFSSGHRVIFIGDVHGSYDPLDRLMTTLRFDEYKDKLIHVGDLVAKGSRHEDVLWWMNGRKISGVRGNHDQPVVQWRTWMEWVGGADWEAVMDEMGEKDEKEVMSVLSKQKKEYPDSWEWKGEHWQIAREISAQSYTYLLGLPLVLHLPSLHTMVVHAGILPYDPSKQFSDASQPLIQSSNNITAGLIDSATSRTSQELSILHNVPQNNNPWNLINMRSVYTKGKNKGEVLKSAKEGKPWSDVWKKAMKKCKGAGTWAVDGIGEWKAEQGQVDDVELESDEDSEVDETKEKRQKKEKEKREKKEKRQKPGTPGADSAGVDADQLKCSPMTVIYGHAAGRGLDIKPFSKGIDTGCVYGRKLTALVLGDLEGLEGDDVRVGEHQGLLVSVDCGEGGV
ncbi:hypothetical protein IAT38_001611 [Cryptococcus sp. DSM 104549]